MQPNSRQSNEFIAQYCRPERAACPHSWMFAIRYFTYYKSVVHRNLLCPELCRIESLRPPTEVQSSLLSRIAEEQPQRPKRRIVLSFWLGIGISVLHFEQCQTISQISSPVLTYVCSTTFEHIRALRLLGNNNLKPLQVFSMSRSQFPYTASRIKVSQS